MILLYTHTHTHTYIHTHTHTHTQEGMATHSSILAWRILMDRGAWRTAVSGVTKSQTRLNTHAHTHTYRYMYIYTHICIWASQVALVVKNLSSNAGDVRDKGLIPGSGKSPRGDHSNPLQYSCLENPHRQRSLVGYCPWDRKESNRTEQLTPSPFTFMLWRRK